MSALVSGRVWLVWLTLMLATMFSWWAAAGRPFETSGARLGAAVTLAIGFGKVWLIAMHFMEVREAPPLLRQAFNAWTVLVGGAVIALILL